MNKKFSTLMASLLLAGGAFNTVSAEQFDADKDYGDQYYGVKVEGSQSSVCATSQWLDVDGTKADPFIRYSETLDKSTLWTIKKVTNTVNGQSKVIGYQLISVLTNKPLSVTVNEAGEDVVYNTFGTEYKSLYFVKPDGTVAGKYYIGKDDQLSSSSTVGNYWAYDLVAVDNINLKADKLNGILGDGFGLQICKQIIKSNGDVDGDKKAEYANLEGNPFTGKLYAVQDGESVKLFQGKDGKQIVLTSTTWGTQGGGTTQEGYKFAALSKAEYASFYKDGKIKAEKFAITRPATVAGEPLEVSMMVDGKKHELVVTDSQKDGAFNLTTAESKDENTNVADYTYVKGAKPMQNTWVRFGVSNGVNYSDFYGKLWNITKNGKEVASPVCDDKETFLPLAQVALSYPEGQWLYYDEDGLGYMQGYFQNRESGKKIALASLRYVEGKENTYTDGTDTYSITPAGDPSDKATIGYLNGYSEDLLKQKAFFIGTPIAATGDTVYLKKTANGKLEFTTEKTDAVEFRLTMADFTEGDNTSNTGRRVTEYTVWKDKNAGKHDTKYDVVSLHQYTLADAVTGEKLVWDAANQRYTLNAKGSTPAIVLKNKGVDVYNLLTGVFNADKAEYDADAKAFTIDGTTFCGKSQKLYGAHNANELVKSQSAYAFVQNDLFVVVDADAQQYRGDFSNTGVLDTIKIFRNDDNSYVLYEKGTLLADAKGEAIEGFLGMENVLDPQYADMQPALLADTAKHANTYRPQYMLAVDAKVVPAGKYCPICGEDDCAHAVATKGFIEGRYLVTLADSAKAAADAGVKEAANKFKHEGFYRLGFVQAKHIGDSLIIASGKTAQDTIDVSKGYDMPCTFAFKYVDAERRAFTIETMLEKGYDKYNKYAPAENERGYIKYQNGVPVVTGNKNEAWVFNLEELTGEENAPTANESINAANNVVVAGVNGAVVVKGAEGKNVIVSTILGKVVANEVVSSDNAQIAAPAGIVVVSVDGESFKVVVK